MNIDGAVTGGGTGGGGGGGTSGGGTGNGPIIGTPIVTFDTAMDGFALEAFHDVNQTNLGDPASGASPAPTIMFDGSDGSPTPGSLVITAPYSGPSQYVDIQKNIMATPQNWMGKTMHVRIKVKSGTFRGGVQMYVKTGMAYVFGGTYTNLGAGSNWQEFTLNITSPLTVIPNYDPTQVFSYGLQLNTGSAGTGATPVTFAVDSFSIDPPLAGAVDAAAQSDGGSDVTAATDAAADTATDAAVESATDATSPD